VCNGGRFNSRKLHLKAQAVHCYSPQPSSATSRDIHIKIIKAPDTREGAILGVCGDSLRLTGYRYHCNILRRIYVAPSGPASRNSQVKNKFKPKITRDSLVSLVQYLYLSISHCIPIYSESSLQEYMFTRGRGYYLKHLDITYWWDDKPAIIPHFGRLIDQDFAPPHTVSIIVEIILIYFLGKANVPTGDLQMPCRCWSITSHAPQDIFPQPTPCSAMSGNVLLAVLDSELNILIIPGSFLMISFAHLIYLCIYSLPIK